MKPAKWDDYIKKEYDRGIYNYFVQIEQGDTVLDLGCSKGYLYFYNQDKKLDYIGLDGSIECLAEFANVLEQKDTVTLLNMALLPITQVVGFESMFHEKRPIATPSMSFGQLMRLINKPIDFLKFDIEGWEACLFVPDDAFALFKKWVRRFTGEMHFDKPQNPRELITGCMERLAKDQNITLRIFSVDGVDITDSYFSQPDFYEQVLISGYIGKRRDPAVLPSVSDPFVDVYRNIQRRRDTIRERISLDFTDGPRVEINGPPGGLFHVEMSDRATGQILHKSEIARNCWTKANRRYFTDWHVVVKSGSNVILDQCLDLRKRRVLIRMESNAVGDTVAWFPFVEEFRLKHGCEMICSTFHNDLFEGSYPDIKLVKPEEPVFDVYAHYRLGYYEHKNRDLSPFAGNSVTLQSVAAGLLGLEPKEIRPRIKFEPGRWKDRPYVCIATESTAQCKFWNNDRGWPDLVAWLRSKNLAVLNLSPNAKHFNGTYPLEPGTLQRVLTQLSGAEFFIGLPSGLSWLAWVVKKPVVMISGFSAEWAEFQENVTRVRPPEGICNSCFNTTGLEFDRNDWNWCPVNKDTPQQFECTKTITAQMVIEKIAQAGLVS